jgi:hypothetical protein
VSSRIRSRQPARFLPRDQDRQLERLGQADSAELAREALGDDEVSVVECSCEDRPRPTLRGRGSSPPGPERQPRIYID